MFENPFPQLFHLADLSGSGTTSWEAATQWAHATTYWTLAARLNKGNSAPPPREDVEALLWWVGPEDHKKKFVDGCMEMLAVLFSEGAAREGQQVML